VKRQRWLIYTTIFGCLAFIGVAFSFYRNSKNKKKANDLLSQQNLKIVKQKEELEQLDESKSSLYANISHELRTPLTLISSPIQYMLTNQKDQLNANQITQLKVVERNATQLKGLVNDILDLSKLESNKIELQEEALAIVPYLRKTVSNFDSLAQHLGIHYEMTTDIPEDTYAVLDRDKVEKVINNLLSNAIKHTPSGGTVKFSASIEGDTFQFQVIDTGHGIPENDLPYIFDRFFQSKNSHDTLQGGTGIGLALAKELVQLMHGELTVTSTLKEGSTFSLSLAYKEAEALTIDDAQLEFQEEESSLPLIQLIFIHIFIYYKVVQIIDIDH
jgi:signal transduction histidine kinase